jgi:hypothetical protein
MIRLLLALVVVGIVAVTAMRMLNSQLGGVARVTGASVTPAASAAAGSQGEAGGTGAAPAAVVMPRATVEQAGRAVQDALQAGAAAQEARASEASR